MRQRAQNGCAAVLALRDSANREEIFHTSRSRTYLSWPPIQMCLGARKCERWKTPEVLHHYLDPSSLLKPRGCWDIFDHARDLRNGLFSTPDARMGVPHRYSIGGRRTTLLDASNPERVSFVVEFLQGIVYKSAQL
jgi:hypothetical protein